MNSLVLEKVVALGTPPLKWMGFQDRLASCLKR
jgi:hypothetical protein